MPALSGAELLVRRGFDPATLRQVGERLMTPEPEKDRRRGVYTGV